MHIVNGLLFLLVMQGCPMAFCDLFLTCKPKLSFTCSLDNECVVEDSDSLVNTVANAYALGKKGKTNITKHFSGLVFLVRAIWVWPDIQMALLNHLPGRIR